MVNKLNIQFIVVFLAVIALLSLAIWLFNPFGPSSEKPIKIVAAGPVTGPLASLGVQMLAGTQQAVADLNEDGGLLDRPIKLVIADDQCDPKQAVSVAGRMIRGDVKLVVGHYCSSAAIPASRIYDEEKVLMISPSATNPKLTDEGGQFIFRVSGRDDQQGSILGRYLVEQFKGKTIAVVHDQSAYGKGLADETSKVLKGSGVQGLIVEAVTAGEKDFSALVSKLKARGVGVVFYGGYHTEAGLIVREMRGQGYDAIFIGGDGLVTHEFWAIARHHGEGTLFSFAPDARLVPAAKKVLERFRGKNIEPDGYILYSYAAIQTWAQAVRLAQSAEPQSVLPVLNEQRFDTVVGKIKFDQKGDVDLPAFAIYRWSDGGYEQIWTSQ